MMMLLAVQRLCVIVSVLMKHLKTDDTDEADVPLDALGSTDTLCFLVS